MGFRVVYDCDRCGAQDVRPPTQEPNYHGVVFSLSTTRKRGASLCPACYASLTEWMYHSSDQT